MNRYGTAIILIVIFMLLKNNYAIAIDKTDTISDICKQSLKQDPAAINVTNTDNFLPQKDGKTSTKSFPDIIPTSLWWAAEQFDPFSGKLVQNWFTYPQQQQINLVVNWRLWNLLDYFGRYRFVNQFGTVVRKYGYSLNIFNQKDQCLASYKYNPGSIPPKWELNLVKFGRDSLPIEPQ